MARRRTGSPPTDDDPRPEDVEALGEATRPCPKCGTTLHDDVDICWKCGHALGGSDGSSRPPWWVIVIALILIAVLVGPILIRIL
jgi:uncharacterized protein (DUF983 family)